MGCPFHPVKLIIPLVGSPFTGYVFNRRRDRTRTCDRAPLLESHSLPTELHGDIKARMTNHAGTFNFLFNYISFDFSLTA